MAKKRRKSKAKGTVKLPTLSEIFEPLQDGWQNIGDSLVWDPNAQEDFGRMMTVKDAKKARKEYSDPTDKQGSGVLDNKFESYDITPTEIPGSVSDPEDPDYNLGDPAQGGEFEPDTTGLDDSDTANVIQDQVFKAEQKKRELEHNQTKYLKSLASFGTNATYTTNYRDAIKSGSGWKAFYDDSPDPENPIRRSDVFTIGEDGNPLGVMTRSQRRAYDERMHEARMKSMLTDDQKVAMEETGRSASDTQKIHSKDGLETVIGGKSESKPESLTKTVETQSKSTPTFKSAAETANKKDDKKIY